MESERLLILPKLGETIYLSLVDITEILPVDYRVNLALSSRERLVLSALGYKFGDFLSNLFHARNEMILKYLLMNESVKRSAVWGDLVFVDKSGVEKQFEGSEVRLYETSVAFIPTTAEPIRVHFSNISHVEAKDYSLAITTEQGEKLTLSRVGKEFDSMTRDLSNAINALNIQIQSLIKELVPTADPSVIRGVSRLLKDGRAARKKDVESLSSEVWGALEKKLKQTTVFDSYQYLESIARQDHIAIGLKRGLMGDLTGNLVWALVPIHGTSPEVGNAIAMEAIRLPSNTKENETPGVGAEQETELSGGNATYFFRIVGRKEYAGLSGNPKELDARINIMISAMNQLMLDINFRREPIYLSDEALRTAPKYAQYRYAAEKIPSLRQLRQRFIGRIIHSSFDQWKSDVMNLLSFNLSTGDDDARWEK